MKVKIKLCVLAASDKTVFQEQTCFSAINDCDIVHFCRFTLKALYAAYQSVPYFITGEVLNADCCVS